MLRCRLIISFLLCNLWFFLAAQDFSNKGKDFWLAYTGHIDGQASRMALYITGEANTTGSVLFTNGSSISFTITANQTTVVQVHPGLYPVYNGSSDIINPTGIRITAQRPVVVYAHILNSARSGASLILPAKSLGKRYKIAAYDQVNNAFNSARSEFAIVAAQNQTIVEIIPSENDINNTRLKGIPFQLTLNKGEVYQFQSLKDLTGSEVRSVAVGNIPCKPIAVFSGSTWNAFDCVNPSGGDNLYQQLFPITSWGKQFITAPFINRQPYDVIRIIVDDTLTNVTVNGSLLSTVQLKKASYYEIKDALTKVITADQPVMVVQYMVSQSCDPRNVVAPGDPIPYPADPEMTILNPIEQTLSKITVLSARKDLTPPNTNIEQHYINVIIKDTYKASLTIDGQPPLSSFISIPGSGHSYIQENVTGSTALNPTHIIRADSGFSSIAYGYGEVESYGYLAGADIKDLNQFISFAGPSFNQAQNAVCSNFPVPFSLTIPYTTSQIIWSYGNGQADTLVNPAFDSSYTRNNKTLYVYKAPAPVSYLLPGTYTIKTQFSNPGIDECGSASQERELDIDVYGKPAGAFTAPAAACINDTASFTDHSDGSGRPVTGWYWSFGNDSLSALQHPKLPYHAAGLYNVSLVAVSDLGCQSDTVKKTIRVFDLPLAKFGISDTLCKDKPVIFSDSSIGFGGQIVQWAWDFGDGTQVIKTTSDTVQHSYSAFGTYTATLLLKTATGCKSLPLTHTFTINPLPIPGFTLPEICLPDGIGQFFNQSTIADNSQAGFSYLWNFNDPHASVQNPNTASVQHPIHRFDTAMLYNISLTVTSAANCKASITRPLTTVYPEPVAGFIVNTETCFTDTTRFTDASNGNGHLITKWWWNLGDGQTDTTANPAHYYSQPGNYTVSLVAFTDKGCITDTLTKTITILPRPVAAFRLNSAPCLQRTLSFTDQSVANAGQLVQGFWNFGDNSTADIASGQPVNHVYRDTGSFPVSLIVVTSKGCLSAMATARITIYDNPSANFILPEVCLTDAFASFTDSSYVNGNSAVSNYLWRFGDPLATAINPDTAVIRHPVHKYQLAAIYPVSLIATTNRGCSDTLTQMFTVNGAVPHAAIRIPGNDSICSNLPVGIENMSSVDFGNITKLSIRWDVDNQPLLAETDETPYPGKKYQHQYPVFGAPLYKTVRIGVSAYSGITCADEKIYPLVLKASPLLHFTPPDTVCSNIPPYLFIYAGDTTGLPGSGVYSGAGMGSDGKFYPARAGDGTHTIRYTYTGVTGCTATAAANVTVLQAPTANAGPDKTITEGTPVILNGSGTGPGISFVWTPGLYLNATTIPQPLSTPPGDMTYYLRVNADNRCTALDSVNIQVWKMVKLPNAFTPNGDGVNDVFRVLHAEHLTSMTMQIYNRWGQVVFTSSSRDKGWNGHANGRPAPGGTYTYFITYYDLYNNLQTLRGTITLIR